MSTAARCLSVVAFAPLLWALTACKSDPEPRASTAGASSSAAEASSAQVDKPGGSMILATTTSTQDSGLLDVLVPDFERARGIKVKVIAVGTGAALAMAAKGDADAVLVHAPESEKKYVESGDLTGGQLIMHNDFVIVGPPDDKAKVKAAGSLPAAMKAINALGIFVSRGDDSGTHKKELELWKAAGIDPKSVNKREETGQGMGATLNVADQRQAYTLSDRATFLAQKRKLKLDVLFEGDRSLLNIYHAYIVSPTKHPAVKAAQASAFVEFLTDAEAQRRIAVFGTTDFGEPLFVADFGKKEEELAGPASASASASTPLPLPPLPEGRGGVAPAPASGSPRAPGPASASPSVRRPTPTF